MLNTDWMEVSIFVGIVVYYTLLIYIVKKSKFKRKEILMNQTYLFVWMFIVLILVGIELFNLHEFVSREIMRVAMFASNLYLVVSAIGKLLVKGKYTWRV